MQAWGFTVVPKGRDQSGGAIGRAWVRLADADGRASFFPVSDLDDTRHTEIVVHNGKAYVAYFHVTEPRTTVIRRYDLPGEQVIPPLYVYYVDHTHLAGDWWPYTDNSMTAIDPTVAANFSAAIRGIARVMDRYGARASWEVVYGTAQGLCVYQGEDHIFRRLVEAGHEVGLHVHNHDGYQRDYDAVHDACGLDPTVTSGLIVGTRDLSDEEAHARVAAAIQTNLGFGVQVGTINMSRNAFMARCGGQIGEGNDMGEQTGNLMFPWRPDLEEPNVCADDSDGDFVLVDHVDMAAWVRPSGNRSGVTGAWRSRSNPPTGR